LFELENKVDHVLAHRRSVNPVNVSAIFDMTIFRLHKTKTSAITAETVTEASPAEITIVIKCLKATDFSTICSKDVQIFKLSKTLTNHR